MSVSDYTAAEVMKKTIKAQLKTSCIHKNPFFNKALWHKEGFPTQPSMVFFLTNSKGTTFLSRIPVKVLPVPIDRSPSNHYPGISEFGNLFVRVRPILVLPLTHQKTFNVLKKFDFQSDNTYFYYLSKIMQRIKFFLDTFFLCDK
jgi:hypothetical protein